MKYITNETISHFKKFINRLHKKEEEVLLSKKKKREETKIKNKFEKNKLNQINTQNHYNFYPGMYMPQMQINNQNPAYYNEYQNIFYMNPPQNYPMNHQMINPYITQQMILQPKTLIESVNNIYNRGIVNNMIGAFFIKECQERKNIEKRKVPISTVELNNEQEENKSLEKNKGENNLNNNEIKEKKEENDEDKKDKESLKEKKDEENNNEIINKEEKKESSNDNNNNDNNNELKVPNIN